MKTSFKDFSKSVIKNPTTADSDIPDTESGTESSRAQAKSSQPRLDPLYVIFEQHLYNFQDSDSDRKTFILNIVSDYLTYLRRMNIVVPKSLELSVKEELGSQVNMMLVKKIYGCFSIEEYQKSLTPTLKRRARTRYTKLGKPKKKAG